MRRIVVLTWAFAASGIIAAIACTSSTTSAVGTEAGVVDGSPDSQPIAVPHDAGPKPPACPSDGVCLADGAYCEWCYEGAGVGCYFDFPPDGGADACICVGSGYPCR